MKGRWFPRPFFNQVWIFKNRSSKKFSKIFQNIGVYYKLSTHRNQLREYNHEQQEQKCEPQKNYVECINSLLELVDMRSSGKRHKFNK
jgi:hypothetical protein